MSKRSNRSGYPDYVKLVTRFNPGDLQRDAGIPASLIHRARRGEVESFSEKSLSKFKEVYTRYWENRLDKAGITPDNWTPIIQHNEIEEVREIVRGVEHTKKVRSKLTRGGVNPDETEKILVEKSEPEIEKVIDKNRENAEIIAARRRERDKNLPGYNPSWHSTELVLKQMARDTSRIPSDWNWIAKYGSPKRKKKWTPDSRKSKRSRQYEH